MAIVRLLPHHAPAYRALMLDAYARHPDAFTSSVDERAALPLAWWEARLAQTPDAAEAVWASTAGDAIQGVAGLSFERREKVRHKATLFGMYVHPEQRGQGLGRQLVDAVLTHARACPPHRLGATHRVRRQRRCHRAVPRGRLRAVGV